MSAAIAADEEVAERIADLPSTPSGESIAEWSPERDALARIEDMLGAVISTMVAVNGGKPPRIPPAPRPHTALQTVRANRARAQHLSLVQRLIPGEGA